MRFSCLVPLLLLPLGVSFACKDESFTSAGGDSGTGGTAGDGDVGGDGDGDAAGMGPGGTSLGGFGGSPQPCDGACGGDEVCNVDSGECVQCLGSEQHCGGDTPVCDVDGGGVCVGCLGDDDCSDDPTKPLCDLDTKSCGGCSDDASCGDMGNRCLETGECVECTPQTDDRTADDDDCGTNVCNPETFECEADLTQMDKDVCESCIADSECAVDHNCVPMEYTGGVETVALGGHCMKLFATGCARPFGAGDVVRSSLSGVATTFCGILEDRTTCESILLLDDDVSCSDDAECGSEAGEGRCEDVNGLGLQCTYSCTGNAQCESGYDCGGAVGEEYCGG